ncbi:MAG: hypothetical protein NXH70_02155 [Hyphomonas sp.]|nr:hypothetical protein [Hyphomonas sp.]
MTAIQLLQSVADKHGFDGAEMYTPHGWHHLWVELEENGLVTLEKPKGEPTDLHLRYDMTPAGKMVVMGLDR